MKRAERRDEQIHSLLVGLPVDIGLVVRIAVSTGSVWYQSEVRSMNLDYGLARVGGVTTAAI